MNWTQRCSAASRLSLGRKAVTAKASTKSSVPSTMVRRRRGNRIRLRTTTPSAQSGNR